MILLLNKITFNVAFVFIIFMIQSSTSISLENDNLAQLVERLDRIQTRMDNMQSREVENAQLTERLDRMQTKMDSIRSREEVLIADKAQLTERLDGMQTKMDGIQNRVEVLEHENHKWARKFSDLEAENKKLKNQISHPVASRSASPKQDDEQSLIVLSSPPTSCQELKDRNGQVLPIDGIHLLKIKNKIKAAYCNFPADGSPVSEKLIGQVDVKTNPVHFYVQLHKGHGDSGVLPFELVRLNEGNAFNVTSGIFTVPVPGIYHFDFSAVRCQDDSYFTIKLQVNGREIGSTFTDHKSDSDSCDVVSLSASLRLAAGNTVNLYKSGRIHDNSNHFTHFSGWLVEERLM